MSRGLPARPDLAPHLEGRHDVDKGQALDASWIIERQTITDARPTVVAREGEARMSEAFHRLDDIDGERALGIGRAVPARRSQERP